MFFIIVLSVIISCKDSKQSQTSKQDTEEWMPLFNGKDFKDWKIKIAGHELGDNYNNTFRVEDEMIKVVYDDYENFDNAFGHLYYKSPFSYYKIKLDYRFTGNQVDGGADWATKNSGIMLHSQSPESNSLGQFFPVSIEFQFLGGLDKNELRPTGSLCTPGTTAKVNNKVLEAHCISSSSKTYYDEQWVHVEAIVLGGESITHIINNDTVMVYQNPKIGGGLINKSEGEWEQNGVENKAYWMSKEGEDLTEGYIALQAESHPVDFKNIEILDLCGCMDKKAKNYKSYYIKQDNSKCIY